MSKPVPLPVWDRQSNICFEEFLPDHPSTYESEPDRSWAQWFQSRPFYDRLIALYQNCSISTKEIGPFIHRHKIDMREFKPQIYRSFAEFFDREFLPDARTFVPDPDKMAAFAEARYLGWTEIATDQRLPVKGYSLSAAEILRSAELAHQFEGGPVLLARLSPVDYHHLHYPDGGETLDHRSIGGRLWTVHWRALTNKPDILFRNERSINILKTDNFGMLGFVEVGALSVGRIVQVHPYDRRFERGAIKSSFKFGGSAVVVFGEKGNWSPAEDILKHTTECVETLVRLGDCVAVRKKAGKL